MAYTTLGTVSWGSSPTNPITISYDRQRSGANMQYKIKISVAPCTGASYFGYPIYAKIFLGGVQKASTTLKSASPSQWSNAIVYETGWITISNKTSGTTALKVQIYSGSGSSRDSSYSYNLTVDPAGSVLGTINAFTIGNAIDIPITKYQSSFTDTLVISLGNTTIKTVSPITNGTDVSFTSAELTKIYSLLPSTTKGTFTFTLTTKNGSTTVGTSTKTAEGTINSNVKPTISSVTVSEENTDIPSSWGVYIQGKSKLRIKTNASGGSGSSISSVKVTIDNVTHTGSDITTGLMNKSGSFTITVLVTDKRGRSASATPSVSIVPYYVPYITNISAVRCNSSGTTDENGTYMKVSLKGGYSSVNEKNSGSYKIQYKKGNDGQWTEYIFESTADTIDTSVIIGGIDTESTYSIRGVISDYFTEVPKIAQPVSSAFVTVDYLVGGKAVAFGKVAEKEGTLEIAFQPIVTNNLNNEGHMSNIPLAGTVNEADSGDDLFSTLSKRKSFIGSIFHTDSSWYNVFSIRHRNGYADGTSFGMMMWSKLTQGSDLFWSQQYDGGAWHNAKTILDSSNVETYAFPTTEKYIGANSNCNSLTATGMYVLAEGSAWANGPSSTINGTMLVFNYSSNIITQIYTSFDGTSWLRMCWYGTWQTWKQITN